MAILKIARMGHPVLMDKAQPVEDPTDPRIHGLSLGRASSGRAHAAGRYRGRGRTRRTSRLLSIPRASRQPLLLTASTTLLA